MVGNAHPGPFSNFTDDEEKSSSTARVRASTACVPPASTVVIASNVMSAEIPRPKLEVARRSGPK
jgi:hypothetical protein